LLEARVGVSDKTLSKHRNILMQKGRIEYKSQGKQKAGKYRLIPFYPEKDEQQTEPFNGKIPVKPSVTESLTGNIPLNPPVKYPVKRSVRGSALFKLNKTKQNEEVVVVDEPLASPESYELFLHGLEEQNKQRALPNAYTLYQSVIRPIPTVVEQEALAEWITTLGDDFVYRAIEETCKAARERPNFRLLEKIIANWTSQGARTVEDIDRIQAAFYAQKRTAVNCESSSASLPSVSEYQPPENDEYDPEKDEAMQAALEKLRQAGGL
jgi:DnaD/phage-associated family protein